jgi:hypothetical protein
MNPDEVLGENICAHLLPFSDFVVANGIQSKTFSFNLLYGVK